MSFLWRKVGSFNTAAEADDWCRRQGIAQNDMRIDNFRNGVELSIRESAPDDKADKDPRPFGY
jgi:hypothetical protein